MSWLAKIRAWWTFKQNSGHRGRRRIYILDAAGLGGLGKGGMRLSPPECVQVLERVARFAQKEQIKVSAVFEGRPLREVDHGGDFKGLTVYFVEKSDQVPDQVINLMKDALRRDEVMVITSDRRLEERAQVGGALTMRISTFRKALESMFGGGNDNQPRSHDRGPRRRHHRPPPRPQEPSGEKPSDTVSSLIDVVE